MTDLNERLAEAAQVGMALSVYAAEDPERKAIISVHGDRTFAELDANANRLVRALRARGVGPGSAVSILCTNRAEFAETYAAVLRGGYRLTTINWHLTGAEAAYILDDSESKALIADARLAEAASGAAAEAANCTVRLAVGGAIDGFEDYQAAVAAEDGTAIDDPQLGSSMLYTSGTTGRPKGVFKKERPVAPGIIAATQNYVGGTDLNLCTGPLYHAAPFALNLNVPLQAGVGVVLMDGWDAEETLRLIATHKITHTHLVPTMFVRLLALPEDVRSKYDVSSLKVVLHGAAPCPVPVKQQMMDWFGPKIWEYYAATEGGGSTVDPHTWLERPGTVGKPATEDHYRILDDDKQPVPTGEVGYVYIKAPDVGRFEYFKDSEKTANTYLGDHFTLGDMGYLDEDGYLFLTDRTANLIISGGVNIYPAEVDAVLITHPKVRDVATIGVPHDDWGETVLAVVELKDPADASDELKAELMDWCRDRLAHYKCPRDVDFSEALPREDNGKIYKRRLRDQYRAAASQGS